MKMVRFCSLCSNTVVIANIYESSSCLHLGIIVLHGDRSSNLTNEVLQHAEVFTLVSHAVSKSQVGQHASKNSNHRLSLNTPFACKEYVNRIRLSQSLVLHSRVHCIFMLSHIPLMHFLSGVVSCSLLSFLDNIHRKIA